MISARVHSSLSALFCAAMRIFSTCWSAASNFCSDTRRSISCHGPAGDGVCVTVVLGLPAWCREMANRRTAKRSAPTNLNPILMLLRFVQLTFIPSSSHPLLPALDDLYRPAVKPPTEIDSGIRVKVPSANGDPSAVSCANWMTTPANGLAVFFGGPQTKRRLA